MRITNHSQRIVFSQCFDASHTLGTRGCRGPSLAALCAVVRRRNATVRALLAAVQQLKGAAGLLTSLW